LLPGDFAVRLRGEMGRDEVRGGKGRRWQQRCAKTVRWVEESREEEQALVPILQEQ